MSDKYLTICILYILFCQHTYYILYQIPGVLHDSPESLHLCVAPLVHHQQPLLVLLYGGQVAELPHHHHHDHRYVHQNKTLKHNIIVVGSLAYILIVK